MATYSIIGADAAGLSAATQIRRIDSEAIIHVYEQSQEISYAKCGLPYYLAGLIPDTDKLKALKPQVLKEKFQVELHLQSRVTAIDPTNKQLTVSSNGEQIIHSYDKLLIATGAKPLIPDWANRDIPGRPISRLWRNKED